jgi:hypothetical protein
MAGLEPARAYTAQRILRWQAAAEYDSDRTTAPPKTLLISDRAFV